DQTAAYLNGLALGDEELTKSIIGAIGDLDAHQLPDAKGFASMARHLTGDTDVKRQRVRNEILGTKAEDFRRFASALELVRRNPTVAVLGGEEAIKAAGIAPVTRVM
ncbi:MAG TPA: peptidase M16, partial [Kiritimatiellia bacterium]